MKVLVGCEYSGIVRDAFALLGHNAWSCDLLDTERPGQHYKGDVRDMFSQHWDLFIVHPECKYMANSGNKHLYINYRKINGRYEPRWRNLEKAAYFFLEMWNAPIERICAENPIMTAYAKQIIGMEQTQIIQPWQFGHGETKATCLWLKNLPKLQPSNIVEGREQRIHKMPPSPERWKERSRTFQGIANAMAAQWSGCLTQREPDSLKAGDSRLPDIVQSESNLPA